MLVSGAAGATGSVAGQIARIKGCRVVGIAGGADKCKWLKKEARFDAVIDYKSEDVDARIGKLCPKGVDVFFDNVGGDILEAALNHLAMRARVVLCGGISSYNATKPIPGPANLMNLVIMRARMEGFIVIDYMDRNHIAIPELLGWISSGELVYQEDIQEGFKNIPATLTRSVHRQEHRQAVAEDRLGVVGGMELRVTAGVRECRFGLARAVLGRSIGAIHGASWSSPTFPARPPRSNSIAGLWMKAPTRLSSVVGADTRAKRCVRSSPQNEDATRDQVTADRCGGESSGHG